MTADEESRVVVVGGGPGGMMLAQLLGRAGVLVTLLEAHQDFDREFRGDSLHPYTLELCDQLGLAEDLLRLPHQRARFFRLHTPAGTITTADYGRVPSRFNYVALMPQARFLDFLAERTTTLPSAEIRTGCTVTGLLHDEAGRVSGVRYRAADGHHELRARLVVGVDGRFSRLRRLAELPARSLGASTDLLWFRLPREATDPPDADVDLFFGRDKYVGLLTGTAGWQVGYTLPKGDFAAARAAGVEPIRRAVAELVPWLADRVHLLTDFAQTTLLSVDISRVDTWWTPGLLLLGDAAHVISPVGGNGILMAVQDAVTAANHIASTTGPIPNTALAAIQAEREPAIRQVQAQQVRVEKQVARARDTGRPIAPPGFLRAVTALPGVRGRAATANAYGPTQPALDTNIWPTARTNGGHRCGLAEFVDQAADRSVLVGFSFLGSRLRRRMWPHDDPKPNALAGRVAMVTGAGSGLGQASAAGLAALGATVIMVVRDLARGEQARQHILRQVPGATVVLTRCDVSDLDDVHRFALEAKANWPVLDVLVHNAGVLPGERSESPQGHEITLATHVLGPMALTEALRPALAASPDPRVIIVSSGGMYTQALPHDDLEYRRGRYRGATAYARTKRLQVAFTPVLAQRYADDGITVHCMHPGWADTPGLARSLPGFQRCARVLLRTPAEGADTIVWLAATRPTPPSGQFWHDRRVRPTNYLPGRDATPQQLRTAWSYCADAAELTDARSPHRG